MDNCMIVFPRKQGPAPVAATDKARKCNGIRQGRVCNQTQHSIPEVPSIAPTDVAPTETSQWNSGVRTRIGWFQGDAIKVKDRLSLIGALTCDK